MLQASAETHIDFDAATMPIAVPVTQATSGDIGRHSATRLFEHVFHDSFDGPDAGDGEPSLAQPVHDLSIPLFCRH